MGTDESVIRVAVGGQGRSGYKIHSSWLHKIPERFKIVAVSDQLAERRKEAQAEFGARTYSDWKPMIKKGGFDLFVNALPTPFHVEASVTALNSGSHVVCEKPSARTVKDFDRIVAASKKNKRVFAPFQNNRLQPYFDKILEVIESGVLGKIVYIRSSWSGFSRRWDWQTLQENWGGNLLNTGPHAVDQALALFGWRRTPKVFCRMDCNNPFEGDANDHCTVTLYDPRRVAPQIDIIISSYVAYSQGDTYNICGTYGGMTGGSSKLTWRYFDAEKATQHKMWKWSVDRQYTRENLDWIEETWTPSQVEKEASGQAKFYKNLFEVIRHRGKLIITPTQARKQIAVIEESHKQNPLPRRKKKKSR